jgi:hypothetical protein
VGDQDRQGFAAGEDRRARAVNSQALLPAPGPGLAPSVSAKGSIDYLLLDRSSADASGFSASVPSGRAFGVLARCTRMSREAEFGRVAIMPGL